MDSSGFLVLLALLLVGFLFVAPIVAMVRSKAARREAEDAARQIARLTSRLYEIEQKLASLQKSAQTAADAGAKPEPPATVASTQPAVADLEPAALEHTAEVVESAEPFRPPEIVQPIAQPEPSAVLGAEPAQSLPSEKGVAAIPELLRRPAAASAESSKEKWTNFEELLGTNFLNKIGTAVFVIGVALFLSYSMRHLGPAGKITVGYVAAATLLGFGLWGELHDRYRILSRAVLGGGWAIAYFTTYALANVRAVKLVQSPMFGFALLFLVAAATVLHSLRFRSEATTGFAYLLAFVSVAVSRMSVGTLAASALLAASLAIVLWKRRWYIIEPFAIAATYGVHFLWLRQVFHAIGGRKPFPEFSASAALLSAYWAIWMISYFLRTEDDPRSRNILTGSFLLNAAGYLILLHYQSFHPELRFWFLLGAGAVYMSLAPLASRRARRRAFILTTTIGAAMIAAAFPYRYAGARVEIVWLLEAEVLLVAGWRLAERQFRILGWLTCAALTIYVLFHDLAIRRVVWRPPDHALGITLLTLAAAFYLQAKLYPRWLAESASFVDVDSARASIAVATFFVLSAAWVALPFLYVGTAWALVAVALAEIGRRSLDGDVQFSGHSAAVLASARLLSDDLPWAQVYHALGWLTVGLAACMLYVASRRIARPAGAKTEIEAEPAGPEALARAFFDRIGGASALYTWTATLVATLLVWRELSIGAIGLGWAVLGLLLLEAGRSLRQQSLVDQAMALFALSFARIFFADLNVQDAVGHVPARVLSVACLSMVYYYAALSTSPEESKHIFSDARRRNLYFWFGWGALVALARFQLETAWVVVGWAVMTVALLVIGKAASVRALRYQAYVLTLLIGMRCAFDNFYQTGPGPLHMKLRTVTVGVVSIALYALLVLTIAAKRSMHRATPVSAPRPAAAESGND